MRYYPAVGPAIPQKSVGCSRVTHPFAGEVLHCCATPPRLACVKHAASVRPEPGSNSPIESISSFRTRLSDSSSNRRVRITLFVFQFFPCPPTRANRSTRAITQITRSIVNQRLNSPVFGGRGRYQFPTRVQGGNREKTADVTADKTPNRTADKAANKTAVDRVKKADRRGNPPSCPP